MPPSNDDRGEGEGEREEDVGDVSDEAARPRHARPTSRRGRSHARRTGSHPVVTLPAEPGPPAPPGALGARVGDWLRGRNHVAVTRTDLHRRRRWVVVAIGVAAAAGAGLSLVGASVVRNSTAGRYVEPAIGEDEPGYQAYVVATPTLAVVQPGPEGELVSVALLSLNPGDDGGAVTLVPASVVVPEVPAEASAEDRSSATTATTATSDTTAGEELPGADLAGGTVGQAYESGGADAAVDAVAELLGVAVDGSVELDAQGWADTVAGVGPITVSLDRQSGEWLAGPTALEPGEVGGFLLEESGDEGELGLLERQADFWRGWLTAVADAGGEGEGEGLARFVAALSRGVSAEVLPVAEGEDAEGGAALVPQDPAASELIARAVPYPLSPAPGRRVRVRLLNGTDDPGLTAEVVPLLVEAGAEITIAGNADTFDVTETTYAYAEPDAEDDARRLADAVGVGSVERFEPVTTTATTTSDEAGDTISEDIEDEIDMTIVLGDDVQDLLRRLQSSG